MHLIAQAVDYIYKCSKYAIVYPWIKLSLIDDLTADALGHMHRAAAGRFDH